MAADGALSPFATVPLRGSEAQAGASPAALSPDQRFLYVALRKEPFQAVSFAIDPANGQLRQAGEAALSDHMAYITTDRTGRYLLGASFPGNHLCISPIGADGIVQVPQEIVPTPPRTHCVLADPSNRYVFVSCRDGNVVLQYYFDAATGKVTPNAEPALSIREGAGPRHLCWHPNRRFLYLLGETDGFVFTLEFDEAQGTLRQVQEVPSIRSDFSGNPSSADLHITPDGRILYASSRATSTIGAFQVDAATGKLTQLGIYDIVERPRGFHIEPSGRYLLAAGQGSHSIASYAIDYATGALTKSNETPAGQGPNWVEVATI
jgi:6-phosphogluconolactonase